MHIANIRIQGILIHVLAKFLYKNEKVISKSSANGVNINIVLSTFSSILYNKFAIGFRTNSL